MALKKKVKDRPEKEFWKPLISDELLFRIMNIVSETGISPPDLFQKWVLQEETQIGFMQRNKGQMARQYKASPDVTEQKPEAQDKSTKVVRVKVLSDPENANPEIVRVKVLPEPGSPDYRKSIVKHAKKFKKEGMTLNRIAKTFNEEKVATVSGTGKWYSSSIANLLNSKI